MEVIGLYTGTNEIREAVQRIDSQAWPHYSGCVLVFAPHGGTLQCASALI